MTAPPSEFGRQLLIMVPQLRVYARSLCNRQDAADDLVQETLLRAWESRGKLRTPENLKSWLFAILRNSFYLEFRKKRHEVEDIEGHFAAQLCAGDDPTVSRDVKDVLEVLERLPAEQREVIVLICVERLSYDEAARICNTAVGTIKSRLFRARSSLARYLDGATWADYATAPAHKAAAAPPSSYSKG